MVLGDLPGALDVKYVTGDVIKKAMYLWLHGCVCGKSLHRHTHTRMHTCVKLKCVCVCVRKCNAVILKYEAARRHEDAVLKHWPINNVWWSVGQDCKQKVICVIYR